MTMTETTSRQRFAAKRAQERCERDGTPDRFTEHFAAECAAIRVDPHAGAFDRRGGRGRELLGRVMNTLRRHDPDLGDELQQWIGEVETDDQDREHDTADYGTIADHGAHVVKNDRAAKSARDRCVDEGRHGSESFAMYYAEGLEGAA